MTRIYFWTRITNHFVKGWLLLSRTFVNGLYQFISSANSAQNSSGSSMDFLNTSSYSRSSLCLCRELWKWRIGRPCKHEHEVLTAFCNEFHRFWRESFLCNRFKRVVVWIKRDIDIFRGAFAGSLLTATMKDVYIALQLKESRSRLCCPSVSTIHQLLYMCFPCASQRLHQFTHAIQIVVLDEVYQEKRWYELKMIK